MQNATFHSSWSPFRTQKTEKIERKSEQPNEQPSVSSLSSEKIRYPSSSRARDPTPCRRPNGFEPRLLYLKDILTDNFLQGCRSLRRMLTGLSVINLGRSPGTRVGQRNPSRFSDRRVRLSLIRLTLHGTHKPSCHARSFRSKGGIAGAYSSICRRSRNTLAPIHLCFARRDSHSARA